MEDLFRKAYRGDPGVPHADPEHFHHAWLGSFAVAAVTWCTSHTSDLSKHFNWHDKALIFEQNYWKKVMEKKHQNHNSSATGTSKPQQS